MRFQLSPEQRQFAATLHELLGGADTAAAARAWAAGEHDRGLKLWRALADVGVFALLVDEDHGGLGAGPVDLVVACEALGYHAVPGPLVESAAVAPALLTGHRLTSLAEGDLVATVVAPPEVPLALDADVAGMVLDLTGASLTAGAEPVRSIDPPRRLFRVPAAAGRSDGVAFDRGVLAVAAQLLGAGQWLLDTSVAYAKQRKQYGRAIGEYQAIKHLLADVVTRLELARPLLYGAAVAGETFARDVSAAKVMAGDAALLAARTALQVHGAIGYTAEHDLGLRLTKVRALAGAWGTGSFHRARVLR
ncbi:acyl-CoA dehydrogenase [Amycolatopsis mediterranei S699]|uniref:Acyl-CoA dehydrogenase n=3 Tax=Amycolatopsis mediterranei TaxID=33910 RepID=A0A0H3D6N6_AMYMU|nr:acyl-CoA dehydrogenase family protein [Amycolatopsis mediterranei]ADJ45174.1 acyl-CoA dehydrogenase [Amycolatopsis mediterranei U32]AEK41933.1 acyl-CoA dehydrogenase [Amycolatopsis mediterranei S699]AFO76885.1 acyl-CoA dehydrogenase [Amycolatopsis mediterranei S699]AGT84013.1 acyl-CoA dehydrogenase [Amycolatopsis mediterranei RB]KDO08649.1 acyl-CoA dehydrogenase [Amycolatopsis mediterranei]